jgi:hypothetical protein
VVEVAVDVVGGVVGGVGSVGAVVPETVGPVPVAGADEPPHATSNVAHTTAAAERPRNMVDLHTQRVTALGILQGTNDPS